MSIVTSNALNNSHTVHQNLTVLAKTAT